MEDNKHEWDRAKWLKIHPEDKELDEENMRIRKTGFHNDDVRNLFAAVCMRAIIDYKKASQHQNIGNRDRNVVMEECHKFFGGEMFQLFINRMSVEEVEKIIRRTPPGLIHSLWRKSEDSQKKQCL